MKVNSTLLDRNILAPFDEIFRAMNIGDAQIIDAMQDIDLPPLDILTRNELSTDGLLAAEDFADEWIELAEPQLSFKYKKRIVIMYQRNQLLRQDKYAQRRYNPYHLCFCEALRKAQEQNRYEGRYVMTYNTSGKFKVNLYIRDRNSDGIVYTLKKEQDIYLPLRVCQHCLRELNWKHFRSYCGGGLEWWRGGNSSMRNKIIDEFDLEEYLATARKENNFCDHPVLGTAASSMSIDYSLSPELKDLLKKLVDYTCDVCGEQFSAHELQIHHKNHTPGDNRRQNLMVVCTDCHALIHKAEGGFVNRREKIYTPAPVSNAGKKYRIYELANTFNRDAKVIINFLNKCAFNVTNNLSTVDETAYAVVTEAFRELTPAEYAAAQKNLGDMYRNGWGVPKDEATAQDFYRKAVDTYKILADEGDVDAQFELGKLQNNFGAVQYDYRKIFETYRTHADDGDVKAKIRLGLMYAKGQGVRQDFYEAKKIIASLRKGVQIADNEIIELCTLTGNTADAVRFHAKTAQLFEIAANKGYMNAAFELAKLYSDKNFVGEDFDDNLANEDYAAKAAKLFKASAEFYTERSVEYEKKIDAAIIRKAREGDISAILELKRLAKDGNYIAKASLEPLYYDGDKAHAVGTVVLRDDLTSISSSKFWHCIDLEKIILPDGLNYIALRAFQGCSRLKEIVFPDGLKSIDNWAFEDCISLEKIILPKGLDHMGLGVFQGCSRLKEMVFPAELTSMKDYVFKNCNNLTHITYYKKTEPLLKNIFGAFRWNQLKKTVIDEEQPVKASANNKKSTWVPIPSTVRKTNQQLLNPDIVQKAKDVDVAAILELKRLAKAGNFDAGIVLEPLYYDGNKAHAVGTIVLRDDLTSIKAYAFSSCSGLTNIVLPEDLTSIGEQAFLGCSGLKFITYHKKIEPVLQKCFDENVWKGLIKTILY